MVQTRHSLPASSTHQQSSSSPAPQQPLTSPIVASTDPSTRRRLKNALKKLNIDGTAALKGESIPRREEPSDGDVAVYHCRGASYAVTASTRPEWIESQPLRYQRGKRSHSSMQRDSEQRGVSTKREREESEDEGRKSAKKRKRVIEDDEDVEGGGASEHEQPNDGINIRQKAPRKKLRTLVRDDSPPLRQKKFNSTPERRKSAPQTQLQSRALRQTPQTNAHNSLRKSHRHQKTRHQMEARSPQLSAPSPALPSQSDMDRELDRSRRRAAEQGYDIDPLAPEDMARMPALQKKVYRDLMSLAQLNSKIARTRKDLAGLGVSFGARGFAPLPLDAEENRTGGEMNGKIPQEQTAAEGTNQVVLEDTSSEVEIITSRHDSAASVSNPRFGKNTHAPGISRPNKEANTNGHSSHPHQIVNGRVVTNGVSKSPDSSTHARHSNKSLTKEKADDDYMSLNDNETTANSTITGASPLKTGNTSIPRALRLPSHARGGQALRWSIPEHLSVVGRAEQEINTSRMAGESKSARRRRVRRELRLVRGWAQADEATLMQFGQRESDGDGDGVNADGDVRVRMESNEQTSNSALAREQDAGAEEDDQETGRAEDSITVHRGHRDEDDEDELEDDDEILDEGQDDDEERRTSSRVATYKSTPCRFWLAGTCRRGERCSYSHP